MSEKSFNYFTSLAKNRDNYLEIAGRTNQMQDAEKLIIPDIIQKLDINSKDKMDNNHKGKIEEVIYHGDHTRVRINLLGNDQFILKIPNSTSNLDIKLGNDINVGWNSKDSRALDPK